MKSEPLIVSDTAYPRGSGQQRARGRDSARLRMTVFALVAWFGYACASTTTPTTPSELTPQNERGVASWYGQEFAGRTTANGEIFDPMLFTAAHRTLPFGTVVDIKNTRTNQTVRVRINDRGPYIGNRTIDLSYAAAQQISLIDPGSGDIELTIVRVGKGDREPPAPFSVNIGNETPAPMVAAASTTTPSSTTLAPATVPQPPAVVNNVQVETRRQVSPSGKSVETVPLAQPPAPTSIAATRTAPPPSPQPSVQPSSKRDVAAAPGHEPSAALDRATHPAASTAGIRSTSTTPSASTSTASSTPAPTPGGKYVVQVGAFSQEPNAKALQDRLTRIGQQSYVAHTSLYFVRVGPFATREQAVQVRAKLEAAGVSAIVIVP